MGDTSSSEGKQKRKATGDEEKLLVWIETVRKWKGFLPNDL